MGNGVFSFVMMLSATGSHSGGGNFDDGTGIIAFVMKVLEKIVGILPHDPLSENLSIYLSRIQDSGFLGYLNYFVPFYLLVPIFETWISVLLAIEIMKNRKEIFSATQKLFGTFKK